MRDRLERAAKRLHRNDLDGAEREVREVLRREPGDPVALNLLGLVRLERRDHAGAIEAFRHAARLRTPYPEALVNLAVACNRTGEHELAREVCELLLRAAPGEPLALINLGMAFKGLRRLDDAARAFEQAGPHPMARFNLGHTKLLQGDLAGGLPLYEERRKVFRTGEKLARPAWDGAARPEATLLVIPEQGLGDFLLMSRFLPALADRFAKVVVQCPPPLSRLVATLDPRLEIVRTPSGAAYDLWAPIMSLPLLLGVRSLGELPTAPWLRVEGRPDRADRADRAVPRVGINWAGNPNFAADAVRSAPLETFAPLLAVPGIEWVSLHRGAREHEADAYGLAQPLAEAEDFLDTARVIADLDLVVSTETAIPNLSAAMGVPTCVLSVKDVDWRWNGWYEDVTVCDQDAPGNWFGPMAKVLAVLQPLLAGDATSKAA